MIPIGSSRAAVFRFAVRLDDREAVRFMSIRSDLRHRFSCGHRDGAMQTGRVEDRVFHELRQHSRVRIAGLQICRICVKLIDAAPFGRGKESVGDGSHLMVKPAVERPVRWNQH